MRSKNQTLVVLATALGLASAMLGLTMRPQPRAAVTVATIQGSAAQPIASEAPAKRTQHDTSRNFRLLE